MNRKKDESGAVEISPDIKLKIPLGYLLGAILFTLSVTVWCVMFWQEVKDQRRVEQEHFEQLSGRIDFLFRKLNIDNPATGEVHNPWTASLPKPTTPAKGSP